MKKKQIRLKKWLIPLVLFFILLVLGIGLYVQDKDNITDSIVQTDTNTKANFPTLLQDSLNKSIKDLDSQIKAKDKRIKAIDKELEVVATDSLFAEKDSLARLVAESLIPCLNEQQTKLIQVRSQINDLYNSERINIPNDIKGDNATLPTILWRNTIFLLLSIIVGAFILYLGLHKFLKLKKMNQDINDGLYVVGNTSQSIPNPGPLDERQEQGEIKNIEFKLPKLSLTYELLPHDNSQSCTVVMKCSRADATIYYCVSPNNKEISTYISPFNVYCDCNILAKAQCGNELSEQITIDIVLPKISSIKEEEKTYVDVDEDVPPPTASTTNKEVTNTTRVFTAIEGVIGISYQGDNHVKHNPAIQCQDYHSFTKVNDIWSVAIVSDGAGSKEHSDIGSNAVCAAFTFYLSQLLKTSSHFKDGNIPQEKIWDLEFRSLLTKFQMDLKSQEPFKSYGFESLAATIIILAYSPRGYLFAHVGDGRAGVKINGEWQSILTPHKGEEANQTIFSTTIEFIKRPTLMMSGVFVPETKVSNIPIEAFVLMSDGCEDGAWATYQRVDLPNGDFKVQDINQPRSQTLDNLIQIIDAAPNVQKQKLIEFITTYNKGFKNEGDDKTILIGKLK